MEEAKILCERCKWIGNIKDVDWYMVETCTGPEKVEMCPKCSSLDIVVQSDK